MKFCSEGQDDSKEFRFLNMTSFNIPFKVVRYGLFLTVSENWRKSDTVPDISVTYLVLYQVTTAVVCIMIWQFLHQITFLVQPSQGFGDSVISTWNLPGVRWGYYHCISSLQIHAWKSKGGEWIIEWVNERINEGS